MLISLLILTESHGDVQCDIMPIAVVQTLSFIDVGVHVDTKDDLGWTPLHHALVAGKVVMVEFLLSKREYFKKEWMPCMCILW